MELRTSSGNMKNVTKGVMIEIESGNIHQDYSDDYQEQSSTYSYPILNFGNESFQEDIGKKLSYHESHIIHPYF